MSSPIDALVIGAGWSGLLTAHNLIKQGVKNVVVLEKRSELGGVFTFSEDPNTLTVCETTELTSSRVVTEISDFPYASSGVPMNDFPSHQSVSQYLHSFAAHYDILRLIRFNCSVVNAEKTDGVWKVTFLEEEEEKSIETRNIACCSGLHSKPYPQPSEFESFTGTILRSGEVKRIDPSLVAGKTLMVFGGGETASDLLLQHHPFAAKTIWAVPNGQHFFKKRGRFFGGYPNPIFNSRVTAYDSINSNATIAVSPPWHSKPGQATGCKWTTDGSVFSFSGHGIPEWDNSSQFFHMFLNKSADTLKYVKTGKVQAKRRVVKVDGKTVTFCDGEKAHVDVILMCVGYGPDLYYLPEELRDPTEAFYFVFPMQDQSVSFVGFTRPVITSIPLFAEIAARWVAAVWSGASPLPSLQAMRTEQAEYLEHLKEYFGKTSRRIATLVEPVTHSRKLWGHILTEKKKNDLVQAWGTWKSIGWLFFMNQTVMMRAADLFEQPKEQQEHFKKALWDLLEYESGLAWSFSSLYRAVVVTGYCIFMRLTFVDEISLFLSRVMKCFHQSPLTGWILNPMETTYRKVRAYLEDLQLYPHDSNVYLSYNENIKQEVIDYYNAQVLLPGDEFKTLAWEYPLPKSFFATTLITLLWAWTKGSLGKPMKFFLFLFSKGTKIRNTWLVLFLFMSLTYDSNPGSKLRKLASLTVPSQAKKAN